MKSYQEQILEAYQDLYLRGLDKDIAFSGAVFDCFAVQRLEAELMNFDRLGLTEDWKAVSAEIAAILKKW